MRLSQDATSRVNFRCSLEKEIGSDVTGVQGDVAKLADLDRLFAQIKLVKGKPRYCVCQCRRRRCCASGRNLGRAGRSGSSISTPKDCCSPCKRRYFR